MNVCMQECMYNCLCVRKYVGLYVLECRSMNLTTVRGLGSQHERKSSSSKMSFAYRILNTLLQQSLRLTIDRCLLHYKSNTRKVLRLDVDEGYHLIGQQKNSLETELSRAEVEEIFQTRS